MESQESCKAHKISNFNWFRFHKFCISYKFEGKIKEKAKPTKGPTFENLICVLSGLQLRAFKHRIHLNNRLLQYTRIRADEEPQESWQLFYSQSQQWSNSFRFATHKIKGARIKGHSSHALKRWVCVYIINNLMISSRIIWNEHTFGHHSRLLVVHFNIRIFFGLQAKGSRRQQWFSYQAPHLLTRKGPTEGVILRATNLTKHNAENVQEAILWNYSRSFVYFLQKYENPGKESSSQCSRFFFKKCKKALCLPCHSCNQIGWHEKRRIPEKSMWSTLKKVISR